MWIYKGNPQGSRTYVFTYNLFNVNVTYEIIKCNKNMYNLFHRY